MTTLITPQIVKELEDKRLLFLARTICKLIDVTRVGVTDYPSGRKIVVTIS